MLGAGLVFILTQNVVILMAAAIIGVISPSGNEIGPFLSVEQAGLTQLIPNKRRTQVFAWYNLVGSFATAIGALSGGWLAQFLQSGGMSALAAYRTVLAGYAAGGFILAILFLSLSRDVEIAAPSQAESTRSKFGLHRSQKVVFKLSALFALDAFAGGLIVQSMIAYWFNVKFGIGSGVLGSIFFGLLDPLVEKDDGAIPIFQDGFVDVFVVLWRKHELSAQQFGTAQAELSPGFVVVSNHDLLRQGECDLPAFDQVP